MGEGQEIEKGTINLGIEIADALSLAYWQQDQVIDILMERVNPLHVRIKSLQEALRSVLVAYSDIPLPIELRGRLRAILEDSETNA